MTPPQLGGAAAADNEIVGNNSADRMIRHHGEQQATRARMKTAFTRGVVLSGCHQSINMPSQPAAAATQGLHKGELICRPPYFSAPRPSPPGPAAAAAASSSCAVLTCSAREGLPDVSSDWKVPDPTTGRQWGARRRCSQPLGRRRPQAQGQAEAVRLHHLAAAAAATAADKQQKVIREHIHVTASLRVQACSAQTLGLCVLPALGCGSTVYVVQQGSSTWVADH